MSDRTSSRAPSAAVAGRYLLLDRIGSGGMGSVWRARDLRTGDLVAAKVLGAHDSAMLLRFVREQSLRIRHLRRTLLPGRLIPLLPPHNGRAPTSRHAKMTHSGGFASTARSCS